MTFNKDKAHLVGNLPPSSKPWTLMDYDGGTFFINEEHPPMIINQHNKLEALKLKDEPKTVMILAEDKTNTIIPSLIRSRQWRDLNKRTMDECLDGTEEG